MGKQHGPFCDPSQLRDGVLRWGAHSAMSPALLPVSGLSQLLCRSCSVSPQFFIGNRSVGVNSGYLWEEGNSNSMAPSWTRSPKMVRSLIDLKVCH